MQKPSKTTFRKWFLLVLTCKKAQKPLSESSDPSAWGAHGSPIGSPWLPLGYILAPFGRPWAPIWHPLGWGPGLITTPGSQTRDLTRLGQRPSELFFHVFRVSPLLAHQISSVRLHSDYLRLSRKTMFIYQSRLTSCF